MTEVPRAKLQEIARESQLTGQRFLFVEGPTDRLFFTRWIETASHEPISGLSILTADGVDVGWQELDSVGLTEGARQRVIWISLKFPGDRSRVICIADLDCGEFEATFANEVLKWTDFPAVESYGCSAPALDILNESFLRGHLPSGADVIDDLREAFVDLYRIRLHNPGIDHPSAQAGFKSGAWDPSRTVPATIASKLEAFAAPEFNDVRQYAYGHDVALLLLGRYGNEIKNGAQIRDPRLLEDLLRASILLSGSFTNSRLGNALAEWLET